MKGIYMEGLLFLDAARVVYAEGKSVVQSVVQNNQKNLRAVLKNDII